MVVSKGGSLLAAGDPRAVSICNEGGRSPFLLVGDHAGNAIPRVLGTLGLPEAERVRHIAWDIGTAALGTALAARLDAVFVHQPYSRLVIDCNRAPSSPEAIWEVSDGTVVPGNAGLDAVARAARVAEVHAPYQAAIAAEITRRAAAGQPTILIALHSFTPVMGGVARPWEVGILHGGGAPAFAKILLGVLAEVEGLVVGDNEPYRMDGTDHTVPLHAFAAGLPYVEIEVRQDGLGDAAGVARWCAILSATLLKASARMG